VDGIKHLVECRCILPQFKRREYPILHKFPVFSVIDENDRVIPKFTQCPNCGIIHKIVDVCVSEIQVGREDIRAINTIDEIKLALPEKLVGLLEGYDLPISTWEEAQFIVENKLWGRFVVVDTETFHDATTGKFVKILGEYIYKVETFTRSDIITLEDK
jgi:hypothetical protein